MFQYLVQFLLECCDLFLIGESDVKSGRNGIDELNAILFGCSN